MFNKSGQAKYLVILYLSFVLVLFLVLFVCYKAEAADKYKCTYQTCEMNPMLKGNPEYHESCGRVKTDVFTRKEVEKTFVQFVIKGKCLPMKKEK